MAITITPVTQIDVRVEDLRWEWAEQNSAAIAAHWQELTARKPRMFNGKVLLARMPVVEAGVYRATYFPVDFASFISWRDFGLPDKAVANGFAMAALRSADGAFVAGVMGDHTANPGSIYFAAGTPDLDDVLPDGRLDLPGNVLREVAEETGLTQGDVVFADGWEAVFDGCRVALMCEARSVLPAEVLASRIRGFIAADSEPELKDVHIIRSVDDLDAERMPGFMVSYLSHALRRG